MNTWKVIVATLVIFTAGIFTGGLLVKRFLPPPAQLPPRPVSEVLPPNPVFRQETLRTMDQRLRLTPEQHERIEKIIEEGQERAKILMSLIGPEVQGEVRDINARIHAELKPEQRTEYERMLRQRQQRRIDRMGMPENQRSKEPRRSVNGSNPVGNASSSNRPATLENN